MSAPPFTVRLSPPLRALLADVAQGEDHADALRALVLLGADVVGCDIGALECDIGALLGLALAPDVRQALKRLYAPANTSRIQVEYKSNTKPATAVRTTQNHHSEPLDDPLAGIGIDV